MEFNSNQKKRVLISCLHLQRNLDKYQDMFIRQGIEVEAPVVNQQLSEDQLLQIIGEFDGVIAGDDQFTEKVLKQARRLKVLVKWGVGTDAIDKVAAKRFGINVYNIPSVFGGEVADVVIGYIIMLARQLHKMDRAVRNNIWLKVNGTSLSGKTLGVIGLGDIGRALCKRAAAMGMIVIGFDPAAIVSTDYFKVVGFDELLESSNFISLNCAQTAENRHMLSDWQFDKMKKGIYIVNTARGPLIDEAALVKALDLGKVAGAALDVFEIEPLPSDSPLKKFDNCIFGTHNSSNTIEAVERVNDKAVSLLLAGLDSSYV